MRREQESLGLSRVSSELSTTLFWVHHGLAGRLQRVMPSGRYLPAPAGAVSCNLMKGCLLPDGMLTVRVSRVSIRRQPWNESRR